MEAALGIPIITHGFCDLCTTCETLHCLELGGEETFFVSQRIPMLKSKAEVCLRVRPPPPRALRPVSLRRHGVTRRAGREFREEHLDVCSVLVDVGIPIGIVAELVDDEALLASDPQQVEDRILTLRDVWPSQAALNRTIQEYPFVLSDQVWIDRLPRSSVDLTEMGWSGAEAAKMIVERPDCVYRRKFEMYNTLKALQRILGEDEDGIAVALRFFAKHPAVLLDWQTTFVPKVDHMVNSLGFSPKDAASLLVHHEAVFKADVDTMKAAMTLLAEFCGADGGQMALKIVSKVPQILTMTPGRVKDTMRVLRGVGIPAADVASYPKAFISRHPYRIVGPRTEYIMEHFKDRVLKPATYLCCSDRMFEERYVANSRQQAAWSAVVAEWQRRSTAAAESRKNLRIQPDATKREVSTEVRGVRDVRDVREARDVASDGQCPTSANMPNQKKMLTPQSTQQQQKKPAQRKPARFFRKRLPRLQRPASEPNEE